MERGRPLRNKAKRTGKTVTNRKITGRGAPLVQSALLAMTARFEPGHDRDREAGGAPESWSCGERESPVEANRCSARTSRNQSDPQASHADHEVFRGIRCRRWIPPLGKGPEDRGIELLRSERPEMSRSL